MTSRRSFLTACIATCTAPAIVRASSLMRVSVPKLQYWEQPYTWLYINDKPAEIYFPNSAYLDGLNAAWANINGAWVPIK